MGPVIKSLFLYQFLVIFIADILCASASPHLNGYYKNYFILFSPSSSAQSPANSFINKLRITGVYDLSPSVSLTCADSMSVKVQNRFLFNEQQNTVIPYRVADFNSRVCPAVSKTGSFAISNNFDRFFFKIERKRFDLYAGRQAIAFGSARVVNPTDIIAYFKFDELDTEDRPGVDALRVRVPLGTMSEWDIGFVAGKDAISKNNAFFIRNKLHAFQTDLSLLCICFGKNVLLGSDIAGSVAGAGFYCENAYVVVNGLNNFDLKREDNYFRGSAGFDYNFSGGIYGYIEYHYNGAGESKPEDYSKNALKTAYVEGATYLLGKDYVIPGVSYQLTPLVMLNGQVINNLTDGSVFFTAGAEYNIKQNAYILFNVLNGFGSRPEIATGDTVLYNSEFGSYYDVYFASLRIYF